MNGEPMGGEPMSGEPMSYDGRPFPSEAEWLLLGADGSPAAANPAAANPAAMDQARAEQALAEQALAPSADFVRRTLQAIEDDRAVDQALAREDEALPRDLLQAYVAPAPGRRFTDRMLQALDRDRRHRWQQMLARHVAPEPSPLFVARTLQALAAGRDHEARDGEDVVAARPQAQPGFPAAAARRRDLAARSPVPASSRRWIGAAVIAAALALVPLLSERSANGPRPTVAAADQTFEARLATATGVWAAAHAGTPLAAVLARAAAANEPLALADESPDGLWLAIGGLVAGNRAAGNPANGGPR